MAEHQSTEVEIWKPVVGWDGRYEVSNLGRVRSLRWIHGNCDAQRKTPHILKQYVNHLGRVKVHLPRWKRIAGIRRGKTFVHRMVLDAFVGPCPAGHCGAHLDNNPRNNRLDNLAWVTREENESHKKKFGTDPAGERNPYAKLRDADVREIRAAFANGERVRDIAARHGISTSNVYQIKDRTAWKHVV